MALHEYATTDSNTAQVVNAFDSADIFNGIEAVEIKAFAKSANYSATIRATIIKRSATDYDVVISEQVTTDSDYIALPSIEYNSTDDTIDLLQVASSNDDGAVYWLVVFDPDRLSVTPSGLICTTTEIYDFAQTENTLRTTAMNNVLTNLVDRVTDEIENYIGRIILPELNTISIHDGRYCDIVGKTIYFNSKYYDIISITSITESGTLLVEDTDYVINSPNQIERIDGSWSNEKMDIVIVGYFGMGYISGEDLYPHKAMKQIIIETCAVKAGLWSRLVSDGEGNNFEMVSRNLPKFTYDELKRFIQPVVA